MLFGCGISIWTFTGITVDLLSGYRYNNHHQACREHRPSPIGLLRQHHTLVVLVLSAFANNEKRIAIRCTWKNSYVDSEKTFYFKFAIGTLQLNSYQKGMLLAEEALYHDILLLPNLYDVYDNLTMKVLQSLVWIDENLDYSYVLKCDDDSFVRLDEMETELTQRTSHQGLYWGHFLGDRHPLQEGKWMEKRWFICDNYLPYAVGGGYVLSADVVHKISLLSDMILTYHNEDVSIGAWTGVLDIERKHDFRFQTLCDTGQQCPCDNRLLIKTLHYETVQTMYKMDKRLISNETVCEHEMKEKHYSYNWNVLPSQCCLTTYND